MPSYRASDGAQLAYAESGERGGVPLLLVHGWQADATIWEPLTAELGPSYRIVAVHVRGSGESRGAPGPYHVESFANDLSDLMAALDLDPVVVVGHSMGAKVGVQFALDQPEAVEGLVLVAPVPLGPAKYAPRLDSYLRSTAGNPQNAAAWIGRLTYREPEPKMTARLRAAAATLSETVALASFDSWTTLDLTNDAATLETPVLVLAPEHDNPATPDVVRATVAQLIPRSRVEIVMESGHYAPVEQPDALARAIDAFVEEL